MDNKICAQSNVYINQQSWYDVNQQHWSWYNANQQPSWYNLNQEPWYNLHILLQRYASGSEQGIFLSLLFWPQLSFRGLVGINY
jgi:hypothetical protein